MRYLKNNQLDRLIVAASWAFWFLTFCLGYLLAKLTF